MRSCWLLGAVDLWRSLERSLRADELEIVHGVARQPLVAATERLIEALEFSGSPLDPAIVARLREAGKLPKPADTSKEIQSILDPLCLVEVHINPESRVKVKEGPVEKELMQQGWRAFLVKVHNEAGVNPELVVQSPNALPVYQKGRGARQKPMTDEQLVDPSDVDDRWLDVTMLQREPMTKRLSGLALEYRVVMLFSRDQGKREASLAFNIGQGTQDIGFRNAVPILFDCKRAVDVKFSVKDTDGETNHGGLRDSRYARTRLSQPGAPTRPRLFLSSPDLSRRW